MLPLQVNERQQKPLKMEKKKIQSLNLPKGDVSIFHICKLLKAYGKAFMKMYLDNQKVFIFFKFSLKQCCHFFDNSNGFYFKKSMSS